MSTTDKGVLIFCEWFEAMSKLGPRDYKMLMNAIYRYQFFCEEPPEFKGKAGMIASIIFPCIRRRTANAKAGKKGMATRLSAYGVNPIIDEILQNRVGSDVGDGVDN